MPNRYIKLVQLALLTSSLSLSSAMGVAAQEDPPFVVGTIVLLQQESQMAARLGEGAEGLAGYVREVQGVAGDVFQHTPKGTGTSGALVLAVKPNGQSRCWVVLGENQLPQSVQHELKKRIESVKPPLVVLGPITLALKFDAWGGGKPFTSPGVPLPEEWQAAAKSAGKSLVVPDGVLELVWPDDDG